MKHLVAKKHELELVSHVYAAQQKYLKFLPSISILLGTYLFTAFLRRGLGRTGRNLDHAHEIYLYFITGCLFWYNLVAAVGTSIIVAIDRTGFLALAFGAIVGICALCSLNFRCAALPRLLGFPFWPGTHKIVADVFYANFCTNTVLLASVVLYAIGWGNISLWLDSLKAH